MSLITDFLKKINFMSKERFETTETSNDELYAVEVNLDDYRWDGEYVTTNILLSDANAKADQIIDLSSILPDDGYDYLIYTRFYGYHNTTNVTTTCYTDEMAAAGSDFPNIVTGSYCRAGSMCPTFYVRANNKRIHKNTGGKLSGGQNLVLLGYRRVGTNV